MTADPSAERPCEGRSQPPILLRERLDLVAIAPTAAGGWALARGSDEGSLELVEIAGGPPVAPSGRIVPRDAVAIDHADPRTAGFVDGHPTTWALSRDGTLWSPSRGAEDGASGRSPVSLASPSSRSMSPRTGRFGPRTRRGK